MAELRAGQQVGIANRSLVMLLGVAAVVGAGCAGYKLKPISPAEAKRSHEEGSKSNEGYIFHAPQPFLLGTLKELDGGKSPTYDFKLIYLPDYNRPFRFTRYEFLAKSDLDVTFTDGWQFTNAKSTTDTTAAFSTLVDLAKGVVGTLDATKPLPPIILFRIDTSAEPILQWRSPPSFRPSSP